MKLLYLQATNTEKHYWNTPHKSLFCPAVYLLLIGKRKKAAKKRTVHFIGGFLLVFSASKNHRCAAKAFYYCPSIISHRPRSQNISKEWALNPEKDSRIKRPRSHVSLEKSSQNYKPLEYWAKPNFLPDVTQQPANSFGECIWRVCHVVKPEPREFLAILSSQRDWPRTGERAGWIAVWYSSLTGW